jgi:hypothetical protein
VAYEQSPNTPEETTATRARRMAELINHLPNEVVASFRHSDPAERVRRLEQITAEIQWGLLAVISWIERRRPARAAELVRYRMAMAAAEAVSCTGMDIPQYAGGVLACRWGGRVRRAADRKPLVEHNAVRSITRGLGHGN